MVHTLSTPVCSRTNAECENAAFTLSVQNNGELSVEDLNENYLWSVSADNGATFSEIYGKTVIPDKCVIKSVNKNNTAETVETEVTRI